MSVFWCDVCKVPVYKEVCPLCNGLNKYIAQDVRPVFPEEILLVEILLHRKGELRTKSVWNAKGSRYFVDGVEIEFSLQKILVEWDVEQVRNLLEAEKRQALKGMYEDFNEMCSRFIEANISRCKELEYNSFEFITKVAERYKDRIAVVSFSGGKDSTVVSSLVRRALGTPKVLHVFGNTTLEMPHTYQYVQEFHKVNRLVPFLATKSQHDFLDLCERIGPPSRVMRWCCTVFKTGPIGDLLDRFSGKQKILTFYGVRRSESSRRSKYEEVMDSPKIAKQVVASPIMNWIDFDIWLYLLNQGEMFNDAYRLGFSRVGCWCCPSNSRWSFFLAQVALPAEAKAWRHFLIDFAKKIGKPDAEEYIDSGNWKARQGGNGLETDYGTVKFEPCATEELARNYQLTKPIEAGLYEYFKPFGILDFESGRKLLGEVIVRDRKNKEPLLLIQGRQGQNHLKVSALHNENFRLLITRIDCQVRKYQSCFGCGGCPAICPCKAITLRGDEYYIDNKKCVGCMKCIAHYDLGCLVTKVTKIRRPDE